ncbi:MAG: mechanosensitive ion channel family protein [Burkholderiales bacterium]|nr:small-conductance mechanosensitive ion channel [Burkholderiales bacterium]MDQ3195717.1 small-conductance mechanosensitive ion channel [Pseudomonadota bacterium]
METGTVQNWGDAFMTSITGALAVFMAAIPKIIAFILILVIGWFIASLIAKVVAALLHKVKFNQLAERAGIAGFMQSMGTDASGFFADIVKWFIRLITLVVAFDALGLPAVSQFVQQVLLWIPNLIVAMVVLVIGGIAAQALSKLVKGTAEKAGIGNPAVMATIASVGVWAFAIIIAVNQLGIGEALVNTLFMATVGAVALAIGLAFGLGGKETAGKMVAELYSKGKEAAPKAAAVADAAKQQGQQMKEQTKHEAQQIRSVPYSGSERRRNLSASYTGKERRAA